MALPEFKPKNILIDYEDMTEGQSYAFTFNPCDKYQHFKHSTRLHTFNKDLSLIFLYKSAQYTLYPEISKAGRLHLHGNIIITDKDEFFLYAIPHLLAKGTVVISEIKDNSSKANHDYKTWDSYINKQSLFHAYYQINTFSTVPLKF